MFVYYRFEKEVTKNGDILGYRFTPPVDVFADPDTNPDNRCFCPHGPPCAPSGLNNISFCQYGKLSYSNRLFLFLLIFEI